MRVVDLPRRDEEVADLLSIHVVDRAPQDCHDVCNIPPGKILSRQSLQVTGSDRRGVMEGPREVLVYCLFDELRTGKLMRKTHDILPVILLSAKVGDDLRYAHLHDPQVFFTRKECGLPYPESRAGIDVRRGDHTGRDHADFHDCFPI